MTEDPRDQTSVDARASGAAEEGAGDTRIVSAHESEAGTVATPALSSPPPDPAGIPALSSDSPAPASVPDPAGVPALSPDEYSARPSSAELAEASRKSRRRARDDHAEKVAQRMVAFVFIGLAVVGLLVVNSGLLDEDPVTSPPEAGRRAPPVVNKTPSAANVAAVPDETPELPALRGLEREGLTIVAEGLPEVIAIEPDHPPDMLAGIETCRFAYAVWEFSPNKRFEFFTTCHLFKGRALAGAWQLDGSRILMSPLQADKNRLTSVFQVERPSTMTTEVIVAGPRGKGYHLRVRQRITGMRPGMDGETWQRTYGKRNHTRVRGLSDVADNPDLLKKVQQSPPPPPPPRERPPAKSKDPLLDLLQ